MILSFVASHDAVILDCTYGTKTLWMVSNIYTCSARIIAVGDPRIVTEVSQNHLPGENNGNVLGLSIIGEKTKFFPRGVSRFLKT